MLGKLGLNMGRVVTVADKTTYIKLDRNIINWRWFKSPKILSVFIWLLIKANVKEGHFQKDNIPRGSLVTSNEHIAEGCGITIPNVRVALSNLEMTGEISRIVRNHYQIIRLNNYETYQSALSKTVEQIASRSQADSRQIATIKEYKNNKNVRRKENRKEKSITSPLEGASDVPKAMRMKPIDEGTVDDIPEEVRDLFKTYADYWRFANQ